MVDRVPGPFEYFESSAESIEAAAREPAQHVRTLHGLADDLDLDQKRTRATTEGDLEELVARNPASPAARSRTCAMNGAFAAGCLVEFAEAVRAFDSTTERLNREVARAVAEAAEEDREPAPVARRPRPRSGLTGLVDDVTGAVDVTRARTDAYRRLLPQYRRAEADLDDDAERVAGRLERGPRPDDVRRLVRAGYIPLLMAGLFPQVQLSATDRYVALVAGVMRDHLPPEATTWSVEKLDAYLTKHHGAADRVMDGSEGLESGFSQLAAGLSIPGLLATLGRAPGADRRRLAMMLPSIIGNHKDAPFDLRAQANRVAISAQIHRDAERVANLRDDPRYARSGHDHGLVERLEKRARLYERLLHDTPKADLDGRRPEHRQIILFDPSGDGRIAEVSGVLDRRTRHVGVYLPGTGHGLDDWDDSVKRANSFVGKTSGLAMVTWIGGDLPDGVVANAPSRGYADALAPRLAEFSHQLRGEMQRVGSGGDTAYLGHSYASLVVGRAERIGLDADRVLSVEGAGMGHGIDDRDDLSSRNRRTPHYSMTTPEDVIALSQWSGWHGQDPDEFEGAIRLRTGFYEDGRPITGLFSSHSGVFTPNSDAWNNMLAFLVAGEATLAKDDIMVDPKAGVYTEPGYGSGGPVRIR